MNDLLNFMPWEDELLMRTCYNKNNYKVTWHRLIIKDKEVTMRDKEVTIRDKVVTTNSKEDITKVEEDFKVKDKEDWVEDEDILSITILESRATLPESVRNLALVGIMELNMLLRTINKS